MRWFSGLLGVELGNYKELSFTEIVEGWDRSGIQPILHLLFINLD